MKKNFRWAFKTFVLSFFLSIFFSVLSQSVFPILHAGISIFIIFFFIAMSVIFDTVGVAVTSAELKDLEVYADKVGYKTAVKLVQNTEKISSFCGDVVGDICGILSGAGGVSLIVNLPLSDGNIQFLVTCITSALIAGLTIFGKAIMKNYAVKNCVLVVYKTGKILETSPYSQLKVWFWKRRKKREDKRKNRLSAPKNKH